MAYWGWTQQPQSQGVSNNTGYESLIGDYTSKLSSMPSTESGGYLSQVQTPTYSTPPTITYPTMPTYNLGRERMLQQQYGSPASQKLNRGLMTALTSAQNRPLPAQSYLTREALSGYGEGLGNIMQSALNPAQKSQMAELGLEREGLMGKYNADYQNAMLKYNAENQNAMLKYQQESNTAMMKEQERRTLTNALEEYKLLQSLQDYKSKQPTGSSMGAGQAQQGLLATMAQQNANTQSWLNSGGYGTSAPQNVQVITNPSQPTSQPVSGVQEWSQKWGGDMTGNMNTGGFTPSPVASTYQSGQTPQYEPTQSDYSSILDRIIPQTPYPYGFLSQQTTQSSPSYSGLIGGY